MSTNELANQLLDALQRLYLIDNQRASIDSQRAELIRRVDSINTQIATMSHLEELRKAEEVKAETPEVAL